MTSPLAELVHLVARSLVDFPERVVVRETDGDRNPRIELQVAREDIGKDRITGYLDVVNAPVAA